MGHHETNPDPQPTGASDSYARGLRLFMRGRYERAMAVLEPLSKQSDLPGQMARFYSGLCRRELGIRALNEGRYADAETHLKSALGMLGPRSDLYEYLSRSYANTAQYQSCAETCEKAMSHGTNESQQLHRRHAQALWRAGRRVEAHMVISDSLRRHGDDAELLYQLGLFHAVEEHYDQARASLAKAVELDGANPDLHYYLGLTAAAEGDILAAVASLQRTLELRGDDVLTAYQLALAARAGRDAGQEVSLRVPEPVRATSRARGSELARYVAEEPDFVEAFLALPQSDADGQLFGLLAEVLDTALKEHPNYADLHRNTSRVLTRLGRYDEALAHAYRAVDINPRYLSARLDLAQLLQRAGRSEEALENLQRVVSGGGDWPDVHYLTARLLTDRRDIERARRHLHRALELNPNYREASEELENLAA
ncbi:MAG: tetratricopeptide repeat protein [Phycisphaerae bacterium]